MVSDEEDGAAIHTAGETNPDGFTGRQAAEPLPDLVAQGADVVFAQLLEVGGKGVALRRKEALVNRVGIGATNQMNLHDVMSRNHAGIAGMELRPESLLLQPVPDRVNAVGHDEGGAFVALGQKVAHRTIQGAGQADDLPFFGHQREGSLDLPDRLSRAAPDALPRFLDAHIEDAVGSGIGEIYYSLEILAGDGLVHATDFVFVGQMVSPAQPAPAGMW